MSENAERLLFWHAEELRGLVERMDEDDPAYERVMGRYEEALADLEKEMGEDG